MKIYLAGRYSDAPKLRHMGESLKALGHEIVSRWVYTNRRAGREFEDIPDAEKTEIAQEDVDDVRACDILILLVGEGGRGGKDVEFGLALGLGKRVAILGPRKNVFHWLANVEEFQDVI